MIARVTVILQSIPSQAEAAAEQQQFSNFKDRELKSRGQKSFFWQKCLYEVGRRA